MACYKLGDDLMLDVTKRSLTKSGVEVDLSELSYRLLKCLVEHAPHLVSHQELLEQVWQGKVVSDDTIKKRVSRLREVIQKAAQKNSIVAERGLGYRFTLEITQSAPPIHTLSSAFKYPKYVFFALIACLIFAVVLISNTVVSKPDMNSVAGQIDATDTQQLLSEVSQYLSLRDEQDINRGIFRLEQLLEQFPHTPAVLCALSDLYLVKYQLYEPSDKTLHYALNYAKAAAKYNPTEAWAYVTLANAKILSGQITVALEQIDKAKKLAPNWVDVYVTQAKAYRLRGEISHAWNSIQIAYSKQPDNPYVRLERANVLITKNMFSWAEKNITELLLELNSDPFVRIAKTELLLASKYYLAALDWQTQLHSEFPESFQVTFLNAITNELNGKPDLADRDFKYLANRATIFSSISQLFLALRGHSNNTLLNNKMNELSISYLENALYPLTLGESEQFLVQLEAAIEHNFATEYFLQMPRVQTAVLNGPNETLNTHATFSQIKESLYIMNQQKRIKRVPIKS